MKTQIITYPSAQVGSSCWGILWLPSNDTPPKGIIQICHGMCEYIQRYTHVAEWFCDRGYLVCGNDHLGHKNTALQNDAPLGNFGKLNDYPKLIEDMEQFHQIVANQYPHLPYFILGHSMGSFIARLYAITYGKEIDGLLISGTAGRNPLLLPAQLVAKFITMVKGNTYCSHFLNKLLSGQFNAGIKEPKCKCDWVTRDTVIAEKFATDPYTNFSFSVSAYHDLFVMTRLVNQNKWFQAYPKDLPTLIYSGERDSVGEFGKGPTQVANLLKAAGVKHLSFHLYPDARHEMHNEINRLEVFEDILRWITDVTTSS